jgi:transposase
MTLREVAAQVELSVPTVMSAHRAYLAGGWSAVNVKPRGRKRGEGRQLTPEQEAEIRRLICDKTPDQLKMGFALWNRQAVLQLIQDRLGIELPIRTVGEYLKRWGFTPQKPIKKAYEQRPAEVRKWLDDEYPKIAARAKTEGAEIHWGDETGLRSDDVRGRGYAPKGQTPVVRVNNKREGLSIISTVTNQGKVRWKVFDGATNADILIDCFKRLIKDAKRKVYLIFDNLRVHHARRVKDWLTDHDEEIEVFYLPSYSPELNPDECLNADLKDGVTRRAPARSKAQLKKAAISHLRKLQKSPRRVRKYFEHKPVRYAA